MIEFELSKTRLRGRAILRCFYAHHEYNETPSDNEGILDFRIIPQG